MATIHYAGNALKFLEENGIQYISRIENAPAVPQARPIERFWSICKQMYAKRSCQSNNVKMFARIWQQISDSVQESNAQTLMEGVQRVLKLIGDKCVFAPLRHKNLIFI